MTRTHWHANMQSGRRLHTCYTVLATGIVKGLLTAHNTATTKATTFKGFRKQQMLKQSNQYPRVRKLLFEVRLIVLTSIPTPIHCGQPHPHDGVWHHACVRCSRFVLNVRLPMPRVLHNYIPVLIHVDSTAAIATDCLITEHGTVCSINSLGLTLIL